MIEAVSSGESRRESVIERLTDPSNNISMNGRVLVKQSLRRESLGESRCESRRVAESRRDRRERERSREEECFSSRHSL